jgi:hypothetical protein
MTNELNLKAKWVADMMKADGVKPEQVTESMALAYMEAIGKKITAIQNTYLTRTGAQDALCNHVLQAVAV